MRCLDICYMLYMDALHRQTDSNCQLINGWFTSTNLCTVAVKNLASEFLCIYALSSLC